VWEASGDSAQVSSPELGQAESVRGGAGQSGGEERTSRWERRETVMRRDGGHTNLAGEYSTWCDADMVASLTL